MFNQYDDECKQSWIGKGIQNDNEKGSFGLIMLFHTSPFFLHIKYQSKDEITQFEYVWNQCMTKVLFNIPYKSRQSTQYY